MRKWKFRIYLYLYMICIVIYLRESLMIADGGFGRPEDKDIEK